MKSKVRKWDNGGFEVISSLEEKNQLIIDINMAFWEALNSIEWDRLLTKRKTEGGVSI